MKISFLLFYIPFTILIAAILSYKVWHWAILTRRKRRKNVEKIKQFQAVDTETPLSEPKEVAQKRALKSVENQFTITKKFFIPILLITFASFVAIPFLGMVPASLFSLIIAATTVILGIAIRPFVENIIAGLVISSSKTLNLGDTVLLDDHYGTVEDINLTHFTIKTWDWKRYVIPNSKMLSNNFINYTLIDRFQWAYVEFHASFKSNVKQIEKIAIDAATQSKYFANHEEPKFWIMETGKVSYRCWIAAWANSPTDAWMLKNDIRTQLITKFQEHDIDTHLNKLDTHKFNAK